MRLGRGWLGIEEGDEEKTVDEEGAHEVDLDTLAHYQTLSLRFLHTTTDLPAHQCSCV
jgi:hypothetical protein